MPGVAFLVGSGRKPRPVVVYTDSSFRYAALLRCCTDYALWVFNARRNRRNAPSMARFSLTCLPWQVISGLHEHNPTVSKLLRYALSRESVCTPPGGAYGPYAVIGIHLGESCTLLQPAMVLSTPCFYEDAMG